MRDPVRSDINKQSIAAAELVKALSSDDEALNHDMIEGETDFFEAVGRALDEIRECQTLESGIAATQKSLSDRAGRIKKRAERLRGLIDQAFQMADVKSHTFACETVTAKRVPPKLIVTDESKVPSKFWEEQPPKLDKKALADAAKQGSVDGCEMSNGGTTIQIRRA